LLRRSRHNRLTNRRQRPLSRTRRHLDPRCCAGNERSSRCCCTSVHTPRSSGSPANRWDPSLPRPNHQRARHPVGKAAVGLSVRPVQTLVGSVVVRTAHLPVFQAKPPQHSRLQLVWMAVSLNSGCDNSCRGFPVGALPFQYPFGIFCQERVLGHSCLRHTPDLFLEVSGPKTKPTATKASST
jgi:hypothetical protein